MFFLLLFYTLQYFTLTIVLNDYVLILQHCTVLCTIQVSTAVIYCPVQCTVLVLCTVLQCTIYCTVQCTALFTLLHCAVYCSVHTTALCSVLLCSHYCTVHFAILCCLQAAAALPGNRICRLAASLYPGRQEQNYIEKVEDKKD